MFKSEIHEHSFGTSLYGYGVPLGGFATAAQQTAYSGESRHGFRLKADADSDATSVITPKAANGYHFKTGHSTNVRDKVLYSFNRD